MKLLRLEVTGLPLFPDGLDICFHTTQRVSDEDRRSLIRLSDKPSVYLNPSLAFIGVNASGKTSVLKAIEVAAAILESENLNHSASRSILGDTEKAVFRICFVNNENRICCLETEVKSGMTGLGQLVYSIASERLWKKELSRVRSRKDLCDFSGLEPVAVRNPDEAYLPDDVSFIIASNRESGDRLNFHSLLRHTNVNVLPLSQSIPLEAVRFLDPTVENIRIGRNGDRATIHLKFFENDEIVINNMSELEQYLSSGTIKGIIVFSVMKEVIRTGGYLLVDEMENHFNREIVSTMIRFFMDSRINRNGAVLIFSTHCPELLDEFDRNDSIFITRNAGGMTVTNLAGILKRNDIRRSESYKSDYLGGTAPSYETCLELRHSL